MKFLLSAICMLCSVGIFAQNNYIGKNDPDAKKVLDNVSSKFKTYKTVTANFTLKIENSAGKLLGTKAGVAYIKGNKYRVNTSDEEIYSDGNNTWSLDKSANEVQLTKYDPSSNAITPQKMFTSFYDKDFLYKLNDDVKKGSKTFQEVELTPTDKTQTFYKVLLQIDKASKNIVETKVFEKNGNRYTYTINSLKTNTPVSESLFSYNAKAHPGVELIDLR
jgi:outer membrane lipoprotein-sorting protein